MVTLISLGRLVRVFVMRHGPHACLLLQVGIRDHMSMTGLLTYLLASTSQEAVNDSCFSAKRCQLQDSPVFYTQDYLTTPKFLVLPYQA